MKKLISVLAMITIAFTLSAQNTSPRWGSGPPTNDNTGRVLTYAYQTVVTTASQASLYIKPSAWNTTVKVATLTHAMTDSIQVLNAYVGDEVTVIYTADTLTAGRVVTFSSTTLNPLKYVSSTLTIPKSKKGQITFVFDGVAWIEKYRTLMSN